MKPAPTQVHVIRAMLCLAAFPLAAAHADDNKPAGGLPETGVLTGIDILARDNFAPLKGRNVGLITNHTGCDRFGRSTLELLHAAPDVHLVALFSPEHGLKGELDARVSDSKDPLTGLTVYSLYGETRRPTPEMLEGIDTLVFDIQDIGARFYTYIATMGLAMEEAAKHNIRLVVLDRPNPITGVHVFGPLSEIEGNFTAYHKIPLVHGMTVGELARMFNEERDIHADLQVIEMEGWQRNMWLDETLLYWVNPSPNMRSLTEATLYPAIGLIEACDVSVGRGTDTPFEVFGAPWIDGRKLAGRLNNLGLKGIRFLPYRFVPDASKHQGVECGGVQIVLIDRNAFDPAEAGLSIVHALQDLFGESFDVDKVDRLLANKNVLEKVKASKKESGYTPLWEAELTDFMTRRTHVLIYK